MLKPASGLLPVFSLHQGRAHKPPRPSCARRANKNENAYVNTIYGFKSLDKIVNSVDTEKKGDCIISGNNLNEEKKLNNLNDYSNINANNTIVNKIPDNYYPFQEKGDNQFLDNYYNSKLKKFNL
jgi:hypothetical protein